MSRLASVPTTSSAPPGGTPMAAVGVGIVTSEDHADDCCVVLEIEQHDIAACSDPPTEWLTADRLPTPAEARAVAYALLWAAAVTDQARAAT